MTTLNEKIIEVAAAFASQYGGAVEQVPDWQIADALNAPDTTLTPQTVRGDTDTAAVKALLLNSGAYGAVRLLADATDTAQALRVECINLLAALDTLPYLSTRHADTYARVAAGASGLVAAGALTQTVADALLALVPTSTTYPSWAQDNGVAVDARIVGLARGGN
jgi:hypothetical protein